MVLATGATINNRYRIINRIGEGGMGVVYRAGDLLTGEVIALKMVTTNRVHHASIQSNLNDARLALAQEFHTLATIRHPNIISVLDYGFDASQQPFFTMTLLKNPLDILEFSIDDKSKANILIQILQALSYLHRRGIIHRDIKPSNVLMTEDGQVKVLDFGLAATSTDAEDEILGTIAYVAPETLKGKGVSIASDLYAVGLIAYELFIGENPFFGDDVQDTIVAILSKQPEIPDSPIGYIIKRLLMKDPEDRYQSADEIIPLIYEASNQVIQQESLAIRESFLQAAKFVGRETELGRLTDALPELRTGVGSAWLIGGESGIGKSRLIDELRSHALVQGIQVVRGQGIEGGGMPFQLWRDVLAQLILNVQITDLQASILKSIIPNIEDIIRRDVPDTPMLSGSEGRNRIVFTIMDVINAQKRPTLLLFDDLQWMTGSLEPIKHMLNVYSPLPVMIVGTYRDDERPSLPDEIPQAQVIKLQRLTDNSISELSESMLGQTGANTQVLDLLQKETEGNVYFLVETVRALAEEAGNLSDIGKITLPSTVFTGGINRLIQRRLDNIPDTFYPLLESAAVAGRLLDLDIIRVLDTNNIKLTTWLNTCSDAAVLDVQNGQWQFAHDKLRQAIIDDLTDDERSILNERVAVSIEQIYPNDIAYAFQLATHWRIAENVEKELEYAQLAAQQALSLSNASVALEFIGRCQSILPDDNSRHIPLALQAADALSLIGHYDDALEHLTRCVELAYQHDELGDCAAALTQIGSIARIRGDFAKAQEVLEQSQALAMQVDDEARLAQIQIELGWTVFRQGHYAKAREYFSDGVRIFEQLDDQRGLALALNRLGGAVLHLKQYDEAKSLRLGSLAICQEIGDRRGVAIALANLGEAERLQSNYEEARQYFLNALEIERNIDAKQLIAITLANLGYVALETDHLKAALDYCMESIHLGNRIDFPMIVLYALTTIAGMWGEIGRTTRAVEMLSMVVSHPSLGDEVMLTVERRLDKLRSQLPLDEFEVAFERGKILDFEQVVADVLADI